MPIAHTPQPTISLNNGVKLPTLGFGVFHTPPDVTQDPSKRHSASANA